MDFVIPASVIANRAKLDVACLRGRQSGLLHPQAGGLVMTERKHF